MWHFGIAAITDASQQENPEFDSRPQHCCYWGKYSPQGCLTPVRQLLGLPVWNLYVLPMLIWVSSLTKTLKNNALKRTDSSKCPIKTECTCSGQDRVWALGLTLVAIKRQTSTLGCPQEEGQLDGIIQRRQFIECPHINLILPLLRCVDKYFINSQQKYDQCLLKLVAKYLLMVSKVLAWPTLKWELSMAS